MLDNTTNVYNAEAELSVFLCILNKILYCNDKSALEQPKAVCMDFRANALK